MKISLTKFINKYPEQFILITIFCFYGLISLTCAKYELYQTLDGLSFKNTVLKQASNKNFYLDGIHFGKLFIKIYIAAKILIPTDFALYTVSPLLFTIFCWLFMKLSTLLSINPIQFRWSLVLFSLYPITIKYNTEILSDPSHLVSLTLLLYHSLKYVRDNKNFDIFFVLIASLLVSLSHKGFCLIAIVNLIMLTTIYIKKNRGLGIISILCITLIAIILFRVDPNSPGYLKLHDNHFIFYHKLGTCGALTYPFAREMLCETLPSKRKSYSILYYELKSLQNFVVGPSIWQLTTGKYLIVFILYLPILFLAILTMFYLAKNRMKLTAYDYYVLGYYISMVILFNHGSINYGNALRHHISCDWALIIIYLRQLQLKNINAIQLLQHECKGHINRPYHHLQSG